MKKREFERETREFEREKMKAKALEQEQALRLAAANQNSSYNSHGNDAIRLNYVTKLIPKFDDNIEIEEYLASYERVLHMFNVDKAYYATPLMPQMRGKALKVFNEMSEAKCSDYDVLKDALLKAYSVVPDTHRTWFRTLEREANASYSNYAFKSQIPFKYWLRGHDAWDDAPAMRKVFLIEQFYSSLNTELMMMMLMFLDAL